MTDRADRGVPASVWCIAAVAALGPLMTNLDSTMVNIALKPLAGELGTSLSNIQWVTSAYLLALALALPLSGWLVDVWGTRKVYAGCFIGFTVASVLCAASPSAGALIAARVLQGLTGGLLAPLAQMTVARAAGPYFGRVFGIAVMPVLIGPIFGPVIGGAILDLADWRWLFLVNLPVGGAALLAALVVLPRDAGGDGARRPFDLSGVALLCPALVLLLVGLEQTARVGALALVAVIAGTLTMLLFVRHARRLGADALLDVGLFTRTNFRVSSVAQFLANGVLLGGQVFMPLILLGRGLSPSAAGWTLAATGAGAVVSYPLAGRLVERLGPRSVLLIGAGLALAGTVGLVVASAPSDRLIGVASLFVRGLGIGGLTLPSMTTAYAGLADNVIPTATTTLNIAQRLGGPVATTALALLTVHGGGLIPAAVLLCALTALVGVCAFGLPARRGPSTQPLHN